jgi:hypothetical protein
MPADPRVTAIPEVSASFRSRHWRRLVLPLSRKKSGGVATRKISSGSANASLAPQRVTTMARKTRRRALRNFGPLRGARPRVGPPGVGTSRAGGLAAYTARPLLSGSPNAYSQHGSLPERSPRLLAPDRRGRGWLLATILEPWLDNQSGRFDGQRVRRRIVRRVERRRPCLSVLESDDGLSLPLDRPGLQLRPDGMRMPFLGVALHDLE